MTQKRSPATDEKIEEFIEIVRGYNGLGIGDVLMMIGQEELDNLVADGILEERIESFMPTYYVKENMI